MRLHSCIQILTLVLCVVPDWAESSPNHPAPSSALSKKKTDLKSENASSEPKPYEMESLSMEPLKGDIPQGIRGKMVPSRQVRKHSRSLMAGYWSGALVEKESESSLGATLIVQNENRNESAQSYGLSILTNRSFGLHWDYQIHCCMGDYYEPNWGLGIGSLWSTEDSLANIANIERYQLRLRGGFEDLFNFNRRLRGEVILKVSPLGFSVQAGLGWTWDQNDFLF